MTAAECFPKALDFREELWYTIIKALTAVILSWSIKNVPCRRKAGKERCLQQKDVDIYSCNMITKSTLLRRTQRSEDFASHEIIMRLVLKLSQLQQKNDSKASPPCFCRCPRQS